MEDIKYFFRGIPDEASFKTFGIIHITLILLAIFGVFLIYYNRDKLREDKISKIVRKIIAFILLCQQTMLYLWYAITGYSNITESLPLYNCRVAIICTALALFTGKKVFKNISVFWGIYGALLSLVVVEGDPFRFPHYTVVSFFVGHILLLWGSFFILIVDEHRLNKNSLKSTLIFTNVYHLLLLLFDLYTGSNYDYLITPPILNNVFALVPQLVYSLIAIISYNLLIMLFYYVTKKINSRSKAILVPSE